MKPEPCVLSIGMGPGQLEFIRRLKDLGFKVAGFGKGKNSPEAEALLDYKAELDTSDFESAKNKSADTIHIAVTSGKIPRRPMLEASAAPHNIPKLIPEICAAL